MRLSEARVSLSGAAPTSGDTAKGESVDSEKVALPLPVPSIWLVSTLLGAEAGGREQVKQTS